jgi:hypothetical protein
MALVIVGAAALGVVLAEDQGRPGGLLDAFGRQQDVGAPGR